MNRDGYFEGTEDAAGYVGAGQHLFPAFTAVDVHRAIHRLRPPGLEDRLRDSDPR